MCLVFVYIFSNTSESNKLLQFTLFSELSKSQQKHTQHRNKQNTFIDAEAEEDHNYNGNHPASMHERYRIASQSNTLNMSDVEKMQQSQAHSSVTLGNDLFVSGVDDQEVIDEQDEDYDDVLTPTNNEQKIDHDMIIEGDDDITPSDDILQDSDDSIDIITAGNDMINQNRHKRRQETYNRDSDESSDNLSDLMVVTKGETAW